MAVKDFFSIESNKYFWVNIAAMIVVIVLALFVTLKVLDIYTRHGEAVVVPDVKGMSVEQATKMFHDHGLECVVADSTYEKNQAGGIVLEVTPASGQKVKEGRIIYLTVNALNVPLKNVPDVGDNSSLRQAEAKLLASGFKLGLTEFVSGEKDWVYGLKYRGRQLSVDEKVPAGATLTLMVGDGTSEPVAKDSTALGEEEAVSSEQSPKTEQPAKSKSSEEENWF